MQVAKVVCSCMQNLVSVCSTLQQNLEVWSFLFVRLSRLVLKTNNIRLRWTLSISYIVAIYRSILMQFTAFLEDEMAIPAAKYRNLLLGGATNVN